MDLALTVNAWIDEELIFAQQLGARQVFAAADPGWKDAPGWDAAALAKLANRVEKAGLLLAGLYASTAPAAEPQAWALRLVMDAGAAKIGLVSLAPAFLPARRAEKAAPAAWPPLVEAAQQAGVKLALPAARLPGARPGARAGLPHDLTANAGLDAVSALALRWLEQTDSAARGRFLERLLLVSFEGLPTRPGPGLDDLLPLCLRLRESGYAGLVRLGLPARWKGDTPAAHQARAFSTGFLRGVLHSI
jgi:hypothetical protein